MGELIPFEGSTAVPAHLRDLFGQANTDLSSGLSGGYPIISYKGKVWHIVEGDKRDLVTYPGTDDPAASLDVVILKANPNLSKLYYEGGYEEGSTEKPACYSNDGKAPAADAQSPQATSCALCPRNAWGSRVTENGAKGKACTDLRRMAVAPVGRLDQPMLLRVPAATLKELAAYATTLDRRKAPYQAIVTKIAFDHTVAHPKFTFKAIRWVTTEEAEIVTEVMSRDTILQIIGLAGSAAADALGPPPAHVEQLAAPQAPAPAPAPAAAAPKGRTAKHAVSEADVAAAVAPVERKPKAAVKETPAPAKPASREAALIAETDAALDAALAALDD